MTPAQDGTVRFEAFLTQPQPDLELHAVVRRGREVEASATVRAAGSPTVATLSVSEPRLWSPQSPSLYDVAFELRRGATVVDHVNSYFGFRTVAAEHGRVLLN